MSEAEEQLLKGRPASAETRQKQAINELNRAAAGLNQSKQRAGEQLARQGLVRVADQLEGLAARQKSVVDETKRLDSERVQAGRLTRGQVRSLQSLANIERQAQDETSRIANELQNADVYQWVLRRGAGAMRESADRLATQVTDSKTVTLETEAWSRLRELALLLKPDASSPGNGSNEQKSGKNATGDNDGVPMLAQLKLLKSLEQDLERRTQELDRQRLENSDSVRVEADAAAGRLADEQSELATLSRQFVEKAAGGANTKNVIPPSKGP
jgi:hypothetical protein